MNSILAVNDMSPDIPRSTALCYPEVRPNRAEIPPNVAPELFRRHIREFKKAGYSYIFNIRDWLENYFERFFYQTQKRKDEKGV